MEWIYPPRVVPFMRKWFLVYFIGIFAFALVPKIYAQSDSVLLTLHFIAPSYGYGFTTTVTDRHGNNLPGTYHSGSVYIISDTSIIIPKADSINIQFGSAGVGFIIDSSARLIRNLTVGQEGDVDGNTGYGGQPGGGSWQYSVKMDSICFSRVGSAIVVAPTVLKGTYSWMAFWGSDYDVFYTELGGANGSGTQSDTLSIELSPVVSSVFSAKPAGPQNLSVAMDNEGFYTATFSPEPVERHLEVMNLLGRKIATLPIYSDCSSMHLPELILPPGLYFARLGNEIAKFVVMQ